MRLDRQGTQIQRFCDFAIVASPSDKAQHFELARAELVQSLRGGDRPLLGLRDVRLDEALGDARCQQGFSCGDETDRVEERRLPSRSAGVISRTAGARLRVRPARRGERARSPSNGGEKTRVSTR
jgi:hypothetical protein